MSLPGWSLVALLMFLAPQQVDQPAVLSRCALTRPPLAHWNLPDNLKEISGLAVTATGHLLAHGDERGRIFTLDESTGKVLATWTLQGEPKDDFEGIAVSPKAVYLMTSAGRVYTTREGKDGEQVPYSKIDGGLGKFCEFEGLAWEPRAKVLLLPCKHVLAPDLQGSVVIFRWSADKKELAEPATIRFPLTRVKAEFGDVDFRPTSLEVDPVSGHIVLLSGKRQAVVEITQQGQFLAGALLDPGLHRQPEGITLGPDRLFVSDEGRKHLGTLTSYACTR